MPETLLVCISRMLLFSSLTCKSWCWLIALALAGELLLLPQAAAEAPRTRAAARAWLDQLRLPYSTVTIKISIGS